jgi:hypothetical protein
MIIKFRDTSVASIVKDTALMLEIIKIRKEK